MKTQRDDYVDIAKGICILLIVCIHTELFSVVRMPFTFIAVPMFFFMSGFYDRSGRPLSTIVTKSAKSLLLPAIVWLIFGIIYSRLLQMIKGETETYVFNIYNPCVDNGPTWFLFALFYVKLIVWLGEKTKLPKSLLIVVAFVLGYVGSEYQMPLLFDEGLAALPIYYTGKLVYPKIINIINNGIFLMLCSVSMLLFLFGAVYYTIVPMGNGCFTPYYLLAVLLIIFTFIPVLWISERLTQVDMFQRLGRETLGIMLIHAPICHSFAVVLNRLFVKGSSLWIISFSIAYLATVAIAYFATKLISRYCPVLFGKTTR